MAGERRRIVRELHDVLAASLSVMSVQATLAAELVIGDTDAGAAAVAQVERAGRAALGEVGRLLRLARSDGAGTEPNHRLADLPMLVADYARAGLHVDLDSDAVAHLPIGIGSSVYRVVQEALTNALKHAPGSTVRVTVSCAGPSVDVEVVNDRPPRPPAHAVPSGHGLLGLRERVTLLGGRFQAGRTAAGGFLLAASIPLAEDAA
jgi:signal transduction histidine kinase